LKKIVGLLVAGVLAAGALVAAPAVVPATSSAGGTVATSVLSPLAPTAAEAKKKKQSKKAKAKAKKAKAKKAKATKSEYKKIKRGMTLAKVRKIIGSKGKRTWYYESTSSDYKCDDGYYTDGYYEQTETWVDGYWDYQWDGENYVDVYVDGYIEYGENWVDGEWVDGECWDEDLTTVYKDYQWKNNKGGYVYVSFTNGRVDSKSWYS